MSLPFSRSMPAQGSAPPMPFGNSIIKVHNKIGARFGSAAKPFKPSLDAMKGHVTNGSSEWEITVGYPTARWQHTGYEKMLWPGMIVFRMQRDRVGEVSMSGVTAPGLEDSPDWYLNATCANKFASISTEAAEQDMGYYIKNGRYIGDQAGGEDDLEDFDGSGTEAARAKQYAHYMRLPQNQWDDLFSAKSTLWQGDDALVHMKWLCNQGVTRNMKPLGVVAVEPAVRFTSPDHYAFGDPAIGQQRFTCAINGTLDIYNPWGSAAFQHAHLWMVQKRVADMRSGRPGHIGWSFETTHDRFYSPEDAMFTGYSGYRERGIPYYCGRVLDMLSPGLTGTRLLAAQGLHPDYDAEQSTNLLRDGGQIRVLWPVVQRAA